MWNLNTCRLKILATQNWNILQILIGSERHWKSFITTHTHTHFIHHHSFPRSRLWFQPVHLPAHSHSHRVKGPFPSLVFTIKSVRVERSGACREPTCRIRGTIVGRKRQTSPWENRLSESHCDKDWQRLTESRRKTKFLEGIKKEIRKEEESRPVSYLTSLPRAQQYCSRYRKRFTDVPVRFPTVGIVRKQTCGVSVQDVLETQTRTQPFHLNGTCKLISFSCDNSRTTSIAHQQKIAEIRHVVLRAPAVEPTRLSTWIHLATVPWAWNSSIYNPLFLDLMMPQKWQFLCRANAFSPGHFSAICIV